MICPECGGTVRDTGKFCGNCGADVYGAVQGISAVPSFTAGAPGISPAMLKFISFREAGLIAATGNPSVPVKTKIFGFFMLVFNFFRIFRVMKLLGEAGKSGNDALKRAAAELKFSFLSTIIFVILTFLGFMTALGFFIHYHYGIF